MAQGEGGGQGRETIGAYMLGRPPMADRCPRCFGAGYTEATMILSMTEIEILARECPNDRLPIVTKTCTYCGGLGFV